jgi:hypothetical protein
MNGTIKVRLLSMLSKEFNKTIASIQNEQQLLASARPGDLHALHRHIYNVAELTEYANTLVEMALQILED